MREARTIRHIDTRIAALRAEVRAGGDRWLLQVVRELRRVRQIVAKG
jgi:hypothetical protein